MRSILRFVALVVWCIAPAYSQDPALFPLKWKAEDFGIDISPTVVGTSQWAIFENRRWKVTPKDAADAVEIFLQQPANTKRLGLRMLSKTYLVPLTDAEKRNLTPHLIERHQDPKWRKLESDAVEELIAQCNKRGVPLFINTSADLKKPWRLMTAKSTIEFLKTLKPVDVPASASSEGKSR